MNEWLKCYFLELLELQKLAFCSQSHRRPAGETISIQILENFCECDWLLRRHWGQYLNMRLDEYFTAMGSLGCKMEGLSAGVDDVKGGQSVTTVRLSLIDGQRYPLIVMESREPTDTQRYQRRTKQSWPSKSSLGIKWRHLHDWRTPWGWKLHTHKSHPSCRLPIRRSKIQQNVHNKLIITSNVMEWTGLRTCWKIHKKPNFFFQDLVFTSYGGLQEASCVHTPSKLITAHQLHSSGKTSPLLSPRRHPRPQPISTLSRFLKNPWRGQLSD